MSEQTVVEDNSPETPVEAKEDAQNLDELLNEYDTGTEQPEKVKAPSGQPDRLEKVLDYVERKEQQEIKDQYTTSIESAVTSIQEDITDLKLPDRVVRGMLHEMGTSDQRFQKAFQQRRDNPQAWKNVLKGVAKEIQNDFSVDEKVTEDRQSLNAAVRDASTIAPADVDVPGMSTNDFAEHKRKLLRAK